MHYVLDSTVLIDHLRGKPVTRRLRALQASGDLLSTTAINVEEVVRGLRAAERRAVHRLFRGLLLLPLGADEGWRAGDWRRSFAQTGITLSQADCLIAAATFSIGGVLATGNPDDFPMDGLKVEHWPVGQ